MVPRRTPPATFRRCGWNRTKFEPWGIHIRSTWSYSRSTILLAVGRLPELHGQLVDDRIIDAEEVFRRLRVHVHIGPLVEAHRVSGLEAPGHPVPLPLDVPPVVARVVELGDLDVDVEVLFELLLDKLHLRGHLREVLVVEQRRLEAVRVTGLG